jgi:hypothetical protein
MGIIKDIEDKVEGKVEPAEVVETPAEEVVEPAETKEEGAAGQTPEEAIIDPIEGAQIHNK